jgi:hypothetical protein
MPDFSEEGSASPVSNPEIICPILALFASSRRHGNTGQLMDRVASELGIEVVDLATKDISAFDYEHRNRQDEFESLIDHVLKFRRIIFASPVYWYSVSPPMKVFLDRISDLLSCPTCWPKAAGFGEKRSTCYAHPLKSRRHRHSSMPGGKPVITWACTTAAYCMPTAETVTGQPCMKMTSIPLSGNCGWARYRLRR